MTRSRSVGGEFGDYPQNVTVIPDSTLVTQIGTWKAAGTVIEGVMVVIWSLSANWTASVSTTNSLPELRIMHVENDADNTYLLTCEILGVVDDDDTWVSANKIMEFDYTGSPSLGEQCQLNGTDCYTMKGVSTGGAGKIVSIAEPTTAKIYVAL